MALEILTPEEMYHADERAVARGVASMSLMQAAGQAVFQAIIARYSPRSVAVLCGPGNNGGDGFVVARLLSEAKWPVQVYLLGDHSRLTGDAAAMATKWQGSISAVEAFSHAELVVDALFGAGLSRDFPVDLADRINGVSAPIVAIDVPSGLDGATAKVRGAGVRADLTVTFFRKKPGHVLYPGRELCGDIVVADIGIPDAVLADFNPPITLLENRKPVLPELDVGTYKYLRGGAVIMSGGELSTGASRLAAFAAQRIGAGAVTICGSAPALRNHAAHVTSIMLKTTVEMRDKKLKSCCIGPGASVGPATRQKVRKILASGQLSTVIDASALTSYAKTPKMLFAAIRRSRCPVVVLTPHDGEFTKLFSNLATRQAAKHEKARAAARESGAVIVYKGPDTVIAHPDGRAAINTNGTPKLATAGSGDVLAGIITGLLAQGMEGFDAACAAVWLHADAAQRIARRTIVAEDLLEAL
jgi:ADP-dependent NAD(P)H-hydrate dehydratase / NAD(P)H-hydrate epimerase